MIPQTTDQREVRGRGIACIPNQIKRIDENYYTVKSQSGNGEYEIHSTEIGWTCSCPDHLFRGVQCKHVFAIIFSQKLRAVVEVRKIEPITSAACQFCKSENIVRCGLRHNKYGDLQVYLCKKCTKHFSINLGFERMKHNPQAITTAIHLYFSGESLRKTQDSLKLLGTQVSYQTIHNWISKYVSLMQKYLGEITPQVSDTWRTDELYLKVRGNMKYLFALMDDQTRFWISQQVADHKGTSDVRPMFREAKEYAQKKPKELISDGAHNFHEAYQKEFWTLKGPRTEHIQHIRLAGDVHNNKQERFNGEVRDREKVTRNLKSVDSPVLKGMQIYHNFVRPHMALDGKTPSEMAGIKVEGSNKWITLIQNASKGES